MSQIAFDPLKHKNGNGNGNGHRGHPDDRELCRDLAQLIADYRAAEQLRRQQLREISKLRRDVYAASRQRGVSAAMLRAMANLMNGASHAR